MDLSLLDPSLIPEMMFANPLAALGIGLGSSILGSLLGGPSSSEKEALKTQSQVGRDQSALLKAALQHQQRLAALSRQPSAARGIFDSTEGLGFRGPRGIGTESNAADIFGNIDFDAIKETGDLQALLGLIPTGTSSVTNAANQAQRNSEIRAQGFGQTAGNIVELLLQSGAFNRAGRAGSTPIGLGLASNRRDDGGFGLGLTGPIRTT